MAERHDVVVVGGGLIGLAVAWRARQRGLDVLVLERDLPGAAASYVGAGILAPVTETTLARDGMTALTLAAAEAYPAFAAELGAGVDYRRCGILHVARDDGEAGVLAELGRAHAALGREAEWLDERGCRGLVPGLGRCAGGLHVPADGVVDPRTLTAALVRELGDAVAAGRPASGALVSGDRLVGVETPAGPVHAEHVVLAAGAWSGALDWLPEAARPPVRPVKGQLAILAGPAPAGPVVWTRDVYVAARADGRVVVGGTVEEAGFDVAVRPEATAELRAAATEVLPALARYDLAQEIAGLRPCAVDGGPIVGAGALDGLVLATGHFRNGILLAPVTADAVAGVLAGQPLPPVLEPFAAGRLDAVGSRG